jgi:hypothetical protein
MREGFEFCRARAAGCTAVPDQQPRSGPAITVFGPLALAKPSRPRGIDDGRRRAAESPATHQHLEPRVRPYAMMASPGEPGDQPIMYSIYFFMVMLLILICGNVGLLLFARAASREADLVVRTALGASRGRIVAQMFAEALVLGSVAVSSASRCQRAPHPRQARELT